MNRRVPVGAIAFLVALALGSFAYAQTPPPAAAAPAAPAKYVPPIRGTATIEVMRMPSTRVGPDLVTKLKIKNTSTGAIHLLRVNEWWYDGSTPRKEVTGGEERYKKPINPGEIVEISVKSPNKPGAQVSTLVFAHANGKVDAKSVKKF
jgi:hypothetical protein